MGASVGGWFELEVLIVKREYEKWKAALKTAGQCEEAILAKFDAIRIGDRVPVDRYAIPLARSEGRDMYVDMIYIDWKDGEWWIIAQGRMLGVNGDPSRTVAYHHIALDEAFAQNPPKRVKQPRRAKPQSRYQ